MLYFGLLNYDFFFFLNIVLVPDFNLNNLIYKLETKSWDKKYIEFIVIVDGEIFSTTIYEENDNGLWKNYLKRYKI